MLWKTCAETNLGIWVLKLNDFSLVVMKVTSNQILVSQRCESLIVYRNSITIQNITVLMG